MQLCDVIIEGTVLSGFDAKNVRSDLARLIGHSEERASLLLAGNGFAVRRNIDATMGEKYVAALLRIGVASRIDIRGLDPLDLSDVPPMEADVKWYYEANGERKGPVSDSEITALIASRVIDVGTLVWRAGWSDWSRVENSNLQPRLLRTSPPPLVGDHVNNTVVWILAFAPIIGLMLEYVFAVAIHTDEEIADAAVSSGKYWYITVILNIILSLFDERRLKNAGHDTTKFGGWVWLVPVYLYQRSRNLKQNLAYFIVWCVCFAFVLLV